MFDSLITEIILVTIDYEILDIKSDALAGISACESLFVKTIDSESSDVTARALHFFLRVSKMQLFVSTLCVVYRYFE